MDLRGRSLVTWPLVAVLAQLSVRAILGGSALVMVPSGDVVGLATRELDPLPLADFLIPGLVLAGVFGAYTAVVCYWVFAGRRHAWLAAASVGAALLVWALVEAAVGFVRPTLALNLATAAATLALAVHPSVRHVTDGGHESRFS